MVSLLYLTHGRLISYLHNYLLQFLAVSIRAIVAASVYLEVLTAAANTLLQVRVLNTYLCHHFILVVRRTRRTKKCSMVSTQRIGYADLCKRCLKKMMMMWRMVEWAIANELSTNGKAHSYAFLSSCRVLVYILYLCLFVCFRV